MYWAIIVPHFMKQYIKALTLVPDFSRWLPIFWLFQNCPDFSRWLPIFRMFSKLSEFFQMIANFPDDFKTVQIFQMTANFPDDFKTVRIFPDDCQFSGWFQNCPDFPDDCQFSRWFQNYPDFSRWLPIFERERERGKSALFRLVVRNGFAHFVRKVFARRKLLPGKFLVFAPLG